MILEGRDVQRCPNFGHLWGMCVLVCVLSFMWMMCVWW
jgi:hypothetical protein